MNPLPTLPQRSWLDLTSRILAVVLIVVGGLTLAGWWLRIDELLQPFLSSRHAPMRANAALAITFLGAALLAAEFNVRRLALIAFVPAVIGAITMAEHITRQTFFDFDEILVHDRHSVIATEAPGRMSIMIATALLLGGLTVAWRSTQRMAQARLFLEAVVGSILASAGFSTLLGYLTALPAVYRWGTGTETGPVEGIVILLFGLMLLLAAWRECMRTEGEAPSWSPMPAIVGCITLTVILSVGLRDREAFLSHQKTEASWQKLVTEIDRQLIFQLNNFEKFARRRAEAEDSRDQIAALETWKFDASNLVNTDITTKRWGLVTLAEVNPNGRNIEFWPNTNNQGAFNFDHRSVEARATTLTAASKQPFNAQMTDMIKVALPTGQVRDGFAIYAPVVRGDSVIRYFVGDFVYASFFEDVYASLSQQLAADYIVSIKLLGTTLYTSPDADKLLRDDALTYNRSIVLGERPEQGIPGRRFTVSLTPSEEALIDDRQYLPELALGAGFGITLLLGLSVHLARSARAGQRAAELSNKKLFAENEERRRVEARLKVSDERLRLALDSTQIGIFEWSVAAGHVYYSPGLWAMLGYEHGRMPSTVEAWQSLIHPDDLPLYRRRTESQLNGIASFIEPEYRVRARSGDWRWVYTRSKSVATSPDGRPTRIIGTVQDITARREAEIALRESQAEARKLSLVASKTDNPVLIGSPDGRIEWANEAFCRVMEYQLDEVVGKNPGHFMVGPETNPRTVARIRSAMMRGQGISTDVVNYSKSGRKYHLHLEIQPVRGASGEVENFIAVETDITARVETEQQLRRAKSEADDASRAKSEFLASMSHEIRTPMNGVIGMTSLLMETSLTAEQRDYVNTVRTSGEALLTIINDILDFSKIESGKMELERTPFELALCVEEALDLFALQASAKKLEIGYHMEPDVPAWILGDVTRLRQVIVNLVNNAVKFTPSGSISLEIRRATREPTPLGFDPGLVPDPARTILEFTVRDTGIGIPADRLDRLFKAFSQVDSSTTRKYGGTGLGLAICQRLTELMGGGIRVESKPGEGSAFIFTIQTEAAPGTSESGLPFLPAPLREQLVLCVEDNPTTQARLRTFFDKGGVRTLMVPTAAAALEAAERLPEPPALLVIERGELEGPSPVEALARLRCPRLILYPFGQTAPAPLSDGMPFVSTSKPIRTSAFLHAITMLFNPAASGAASISKSNERPVGHDIPLEILLAEDNAVNQKVALRFLDRLGYRAVAVANGVETVAAIEGHRYDLVLMDLQMPEMDGFEATRQIRARLPADRQPKIIALTANAMQGDRELCVAAGMDDYISKPVKMHEISAAIRKHFAKPSPTPASRQMIG